MPHFVGPPGSGKSTVARQLADLVGVNLHVVNVSRISPLGLEGLEMPDREHSALRLLVSEMWTQAQPGDIYLFDEFLRGFPEVYNGLLDIFTSREVRGFELPKVFIMGASNTTVAYDAALEDRLLHIPVPDPRKRKGEKQRLIQMLVDSLGLHPKTVDAYAMHEVMEIEVLPTFEVLDWFEKSKDKHKIGAGATPGTMKGSSIRKLIGQAQLRQVQSNVLKQLIAENNRIATVEKKWQYVFLLTGKDAPAGYESAATGIRNSPKLTATQRMNLELNLQLIEMEKAKAETTQKERDDEDDDIFSE